MSAKPPAWSKADLEDRNPHDAADKAARIRDMFAAIAPSYDLNNRLHSLWRDQAWRRAAVRFAMVQQGDIVLDVACGTGDLSFAFAKSPADKVLGQDFTAEMLDVARAKQTVSQSPAMGKIEFTESDAMDLPLADNSVDVVSIAFGIRNVSIPAKAIAEFYRVLRPGGRVIILEFSLPKNPILRYLYNLYFHHVLPRTASLIARDKSGAYRYLPQSVNKFITRSQMLEMLADAEFEQTTLRSLTLGIAVIYRGIRKR